MERARNDLAIESQWVQIRGQLKKEFGDAAFRSWLKPMSLAEVRSSGVVRVAAPTRFMRDWVASNYAARIEELWRTENPKIKGVEVIVRPGRAEDVARLENEDDDAGGRPAPVSEVAAPPAYRPSARYDERTDISAALDPRFTFDSFVVGKPNEFAYAAAQRVAEAGAVTFNPLFLYGGVGLGKTHLMHAIAWHIQKLAPHRSVVYLSAEKFMYRFIRALRERNTMDFKEQFRSVDVLMIDDVQFIGGKDSTQEEFFHTFNALVDQGRQIVISADKSPAALEDMEERLRSRLGCGLVADIHSTTYELRLGILQSKAEKMGVPVPDKIMEFLSHKITSNVRELEGALNRVIAHSQLVGREITLETVQDVLHDLLR
ncbi:MAG: chromosomal replication initiator protein DnaA, partial [Rhodospirillales bacterium]